MSAPLVSVLIPAYHERFFGEAFASARAQTWPALEIVVCDDSPGTAIGEAVRAAADARVRYVRNPANLGFAANFTQCFRLARGEYVKFLNDDDRLRPQCVEGLVAGFDFDPRVTLATSRRIAVDDAGRPRNDVQATWAVSHVSCLIPGAELGNFCLLNSANLIGEPSTAMFRRRDVALEPGGIFTWNGQRFHVLADLSLWLRLLARGHCFYQAVPLSEFRVHAGQEQQGRDMDVAAVVERHALAREARRAGFLQVPEHYRAALAQVVARADQWLARPDLEAVHVARLEQLKAQVGAELAAL